MSPKWNLRDTSTRSEEQLLLLVLLGPLTLYDLSLEAVRLVGRFDEVLRLPGNMVASDWLGVFASPLLFHFSLALLAGGLIYAGASLHLRGAAVVLLQIICIATALSETGAHIYFLHTASPLDWGKAFAYIARPDEMALLASGSVNAAQKAGLALILLLVAAGPWVALPLQRRLSGQLVSEQPPAWMSAVLIAVAPMVGAMGLLPWTEFTTDHAVVRDPVLHFIATLIDAPVPDLAAAEAAARAGRAFELRIVRKRDVPPMNVVFVILESTRARSTTLMHPERLTTPFLAELAEKSLVVDRAYTVVPHTSHALVALLCGLEPSHNWHPKAVALGLLKRCLPQLLDEQGYETVFFQSAAASFEARVPTTTSMGFATFIGTDKFNFDGFQRANWLGYEDDVMLEPSRVWLEAHKGKPIFATYMTVNPHEVVEPLTRHGFEDFSPDADVNRYENAVRADDFFLRQLVDQWKAAGLYQNTLWVIVGDHGEGFGEHGLRAHDQVPYEEGMRIPLLLHDPTGRQIKPGHVLEPAHQLDIMPTVLEALGFRPEGSALHGLPLTARQTIRPLMGSCNGEATCLVEIAGTEKFIHHFGRQADEFFDLARDPDERTNLYPQRRAEAERMLQELLVWDRRVKGLYWAEELQAAHHP